MLCYVTISFSLDKKRIVFWNYLLNLIWFLFHSLHWIRYNQFVLCESVTLFLYLSYYSRHFIFTKFCCLADKYDRTCPTSLHSFWIVIMKVLNSAIVSLLLLYCNWFHRCYYFLRFWTKIKSFRLCFPFVFPAKSISGGPEIHGKS